MGGYLKNTFFDLYWGKRRRNQGQKADASVLCTTRRAACGRSL